MFIKKIACSGNWSTGREPRTTAGITPGNRNLNFLDLTAWKLPSSRWCQEPAWVWGNLMRIVSSISKVEATGWLCVHLWRNSSGWSRAVPALRSLQHHLKPRECGLYWFRYLAFWTHVSFKHQPSIQTGCKCEISILYFLSRFRNKKKQQRKHMQYISSVMQTWLRFLTVYNMKSLKHWAAVLWIRGATPSLF